MKVNVSVIMPAHNASAYIEEAIQSVLAQDYGPFELIIGNDASTDKTKTILEPYKFHPKIQLYTTRIKMGAARMRNKLAQLANGKYLSPCDADDLMLSGNLKKFSTYLDRHPEVGIVYGNILSSWVGEKRKLSAAPVLLGKDANAAWDLCENTVNHGGSMIRKTLFLSVGGYENIPIAEDWSLWLKLSEITKFKYLSDDPYYAWRRHPLSLTCAHAGKNSTCRDILRIFRKTVERRYKIKF